MKKTIIAAVMVILCGSAKAQYNETNSLFYNTFRTPQSGELNPALFPNKASFYLSLPGFGMQFGSPLAINDFMHTQGDSITVINLNKAMDALGKDNNIHFGINANLFGLGFKVNNMFFTFNSRLVTNLNINIPRELVDAVQHGNTDASGNPIPEVNVLCGDILNSTTYAEIAVGAGYRIEPLNLTVGARAKYLYGLANIQTDNTIAVITTAPDYSQIRADIYYDFITAGVAGLDSNGRFKMDTKNLLSGNSGFAFDIGARYDLGPFTFSFAINDLSAGIHWKNNVTTWTPSNGQGVITFNGLDVNSMLDNGTFSTDSLTAYLNEQLGGMTPLVDDQSRRLLVRHPHQVQPRRQLQLRQDLPRRPPLPRPARPRPLLQVQPSSGVAQQCRQHLPLEHHPLRRRQPLQLGRSRRRQLRCLRRLLPRCPQSRHRPRPHPRHHLPGLCDGRLPQLLLPHRLQSLQPQARPQPPLRQGRQAARQ